MKTISLSLLIISTALIISFSSCTEESCNQDTEVFMKAGFYSSETEEKISIDSLDIYGLNVPDSIICSMSTLNEVSLPLNPSSSSCTFAIVNGGRADTIEIFYKSSLEFLSLACGYRYLHELEEIYNTRNDIKDIFILNKSVNPGDEENVQIFF